MRIMFTSLFLAVLSVAFAQDDRTLFTIDGTDVKVSEFEYIYNKNNFDNKADYSKASIDEYLDLYIRFRLKVKEAESLDYDKNTDLISELNTYKRQLYESYFDKQVTSKLVDEVLERKKKDISISHIYVASKARDNDSKKESAKKQINELYDKLESGAVFEDLARKMSNDKYSAQNGGLLGYFTGLQIAQYPLENVVYATEVGAYSKPVQTNIGYHIVKVNDERPARGEVKVAIIKKSKNKKDPTSNEKAEKSINEIYAQLKKGEDFAVLAQTMSDDKATATNGGELDWFGISEYNQTFEDAAFSLQNNGDYSEPIELAEGWYIIKRIDAKGYEGIIVDKEKIKEAVKNSDRYGIKRTEYFEKILDSYGHVKNEANLNAYKSEMVERLTARGISLEPKEDAKVILTIGEKAFDENDLEKFIARNYRRSRAINNEEKFDELFKLFTDEKTLLYHQDKLAEEDNDYAALLNEYRDGILLFELTEKEIWSKAVEDTVGLKEFFYANRNKFKWNERATVQLYKVEGPKEIKVGRKLFKKIPKLGESKVFSKLEAKGININQPEVRSFENGVDKVELNYTNGATGLLNLEGLDYLYKVESVLPTEQKELDEVRGFAIAAYQEYLEEAWVEKLKAKYPIVVNEAVLNTLVKK